MTTTGICEVEGIQVGHWTDRQGLTGCTAILCPPGTMGSGEVRGGAPATRETDLLRPGTMVQEVHGVLLTGGSAFGLASADGVMRWLEERGVGFDAVVARVPIVPTAALFDLGVGDPKARPGPDQGYSACEAAGPAAGEGSVGAGTGATVAKLFGPHRAVKGGLGMAAADDGGVTVGALAAVNAFGEVVGEDEAVIAGARPAGPGEEDEQPPGGDWARPGTSTTLAVVATDATLSKERAHLLARAAHDGIGRAVRPAHTMVDGDTIFTLATGRTEAPQALLERMAEAVLAEAIRRAVRVAEGFPGIPAATEGAR
ncbi:MAG TPA: P1 family peptidase [Actinomycetota bacterium]|nr:P1 family peptidase [Actinomycetota bacterium]